MKKLFCVMLCFCLLMALNACSLEELLNPFSPRQPATEPQSDFSYPTEYFVPSYPTEPETEPYVPTEPETEPYVPTEPETEPESPCPYLVTVKNHDQSIFSLPTYDSFCTDTVREAGVYTIVEESIDDEGRLWGRLKSGKGWIELESANAFNRQIPPISAGLMNYSAPAGSLIANVSAEYSIPVIFHAYTVLLDVRLYGLVWNGEEEEPAEPFYIAPEMRLKTPLVAYLEFPGDMTMYGISFRDADGNFHHYRITQNGRNNDLSFSPYDPN